MRWRQCVRRARDDRHPEHRDRVVWDVYEAERPFLAPLACPFAGFYQIGEDASLLDGQRHAPGRPTTWRWAP